MCTVLTAALPYPHAVIPIEPDDDRSRCGALVTDAKGACSQFGRPQVGSELVHALGVCRLELKLMGRRRHRNRGVLAQHQDQACLTSRAGDASPPRRAIGRHRARVTGDTR